MLQPLFPQLRQVGLSGVDETPPVGTVGFQVEDICRRKAQAVDSLPYDLVIVADTMLADPEHQHLSIGKPKDKQQATQMLNRLCGRIHEVWTATGIFWQGSWTFWCESAQVSIPLLSLEELSFLLESASWEGKAGAYDLAGQMGQFAKLVGGEISTVLGIAGSAMAMLSDIAEKK